MSQSKRYQSGIMYHRSRVARMTRGWMDVSAIRAIHLFTASLINLALQMTRLFIIFWNEFGKPQRAQRTQRKEQCSVTSASSVVNLLCHNPSTKKSKSHCLPDVQKSKRCNLQPVPAGPHAPTPGAHPCSASPSLCPRHACAIPLICAPSLSILAPPCRGHRRSS